MAQAEFISDGLLIDFTPASAIAAGEVVVQGDLIGIASRAIAANQRGSLCVRGVFDCTKNTGVAYTVGLLLYWDNTNKVVTTTASGNKLLGKVVAAALTTDVTVRVLVG